ncbi:hypothetical protein E1B28_005990 [Marasmius oreades]|uniref:Uncharacterized protein n=1 Tax=Marasmius oreades TaxID=181124 RepID=A0A9P7S4Y6_9AGAR|nr:uncharacterized protein E1B28_005990 [Marasmius oreades]KAG7095215.1 hypothetical protein E1B28_005990 [Marasmius oreades]
MTGTINVDISTVHLVFRREDWVGKNLKWNDEIPLCVREARDCDRRPPRGFMEDLVPPRSSTVSQILIRGTTYAASYPLFQDSETRSSYRNLQPTLPKIMDAPDYLLQRFLLACQPHSMQLTSSFNDAWLSGCRSICLSGDPTYRVPIWCETVVRELTAFTKVYGQWNDAMDWLFNVPNTFGSESLIDDSRLVSTWLPSNSRLLGFSKSIHLTSLDLTLLLSDEWLNDELINAGFRIHFASAGRP